MFAEYLLLTTFLKLKGVFIMITKKKVVLLANGIEIADLRYEAIEIIVDIGRIEEIWEKTRHPCY